MSIFHSKNPKLVEQVEEWYRYSRDSLSKYRRQIREDFDFYCGKQWDASDKQFLEENRRPIVTFNRIGTTIDAVAGTEIVNRQATRYLPRTTQQGEDDGPVAEMYSSVARWVRDLADAEDEESEAFKDVLIGGIGWTETWLDTDDDPGGQIRIQHINSMEMLWDPDASRANLSDTLYRMRVRHMDRAQIKARWPGARLKAKSELTNEDIPDDPHDATAAKFYINNASRKHPSRKDILVKQVQWWEKVPMFQALNPETGEQEQLTREEMDAALALIPDLDFVRFTKRRYYQAFIGGGTVLEKQELHGGNVPGFTMHAITGRRDSDGRWFGLMRAMKDPQRWSNKFYSQILDILNSQAKGGVLAEKGAFANQAQAEEDWAKPDAIVWAADGALTGNKIQDRKTANFPSGLDRMMQTANDAVRDASGVSVEFLGTAARTQSGVVESGRVRQGLATLAVFFNSLRRYRKDQGRVLLHFINEYIDEGEVIRIVGEDRFVPFRKDADQRKYDIIVDEAPDSPNMKQEVWGTLQQILPALLKSGQPVPIQELLEFSPLPSSVAARVKKFYASQGPSDEEKALKSAAMNLEIEKQRADIQVAESSAIEKRAKAQSNIRARDNDAEKTQLEGLRVLDEIMDKPPKETDNGNT